MGYIGSGATSSSANVINDDSIKDDIQVSTTKANGKKCPVCWKIRSDECERHGRTLILPPAYSLFGVYVNGVRLVPQTDYTYSGNILTINNDLNSGDGILVETFTTNKALTTSVALTTLGGTFTGTLEGPEFIRTNTTQPTDTQMMVRKNSPYLGPNSLIRTNSRTVDESITIPTGTNGMSVGPITISANVTVTIETNGEWVVV